MKKTISILFTLLFSIYSFAQKTEIIVLGNIHQPVPNYNSDTIVTILDKIKPDFLLQEIDSSFFNVDFTFKTPPKENEGLASVKYIDKNTKAQMRPFDFEGRNEYRKINGFNPTEGLALKLVDSLYNENRLTKKQAKVYKKYIDLLEPLKIAASKDPRSFNNSINDKICKERQYYQYHKLLSVMKERSELSNTYYTQANAQKISYLKGFQLASEFWDLRNKTMAKNILKIAEENPGKKIIVLTGFMHRYYIISELKKLTKKDRNIIMKEFYD
ncbi:hypothetical protein KO02_09245 [Sphingobacterium sp. ML3W]|uniref:hypothetical protein n=1 Tax=Sphingobacterium TaxID=28453 RepID=UPI0004F5D748|nr:MULTISPECIES: hypothetical protein [Sphingobacterium]AIM36862.1 hypothetical protein KO02_09245 [Sphingobacterium sp. ML3W]MDH5826984.1 hypothetical protein [Sphingobacterium faecium]